MSFEIDYQLIAESLLQRKLGTGDGVDQKSLELANRRIGHPLPKAWSDYLLVIGKHPLNRAHDRLIPPEDLEIDLLHQPAVIVVDENQSVCSWSVLQRDLVIDDPPLQYRDDSRGWQQQSLTLSSFLKFFMYYQACLGGLNYSGLPVNTELNVGGCSPGLDQVRNISRRNLLEM